MVTSCGKLRLREVKPPARAFEFASGTASVPAAHLVPGSHPDGKGSVMTSSQPGGLSGTGRVG